jgi:hypothetical protein
VQLQALPLFETLIRSTGNCGNSIRPGLSLHAIISRRMDSIADLAYWLPVTVIQELLGLPPVRFE